jgi:hypothetical protein
VNDVRWERGTDGRVKAWVCAEWDRVRLRKCADIVQDRFAGEARDRVGGAELVFWDFMVANVLITVHLEQGVGIAILCNESSLPSETLVRQIAEYLLLHAQL